LIPGFPLDGGRVFRAIVWGVNKNFRRATLIAASTGRFFGFLFIALGVWQVLGGNIFNGLWIAFIGWFLESAAGSQLQMQMFQGLLGGHKVVEAMGNECARTSGNTPLQKLVDEQILSHGQRCFLVEVGDRVVGFLTLHDIKAVPRASWPATTAADVMIPFDRLNTIGPDAELWTALNKMGKDGVNQMPIMRENQFVGMVTRGDILKYLQTLEQLRT
jgi:CBS domain-containing protein